MTIDLTTIAAAIVAALSVARMARFVVDDDFPYFVRLREWWKMNTGPWGELAVCPFCIAVWLSWAVVAWAWISELHWTWWFWNGSLAVAYVAAIVNVRDIPRD